MSFDLFQNDTEKTTIKVPKCPYFANMTFWQTMACLLDVNM